MLAVMEVKRTRKRVDDINYASKVKFHWSVVTARAKGSEINKEERLSSIAFLENQIDNVILALEKLTHQGGRDEAFLKEVYSVISICKTWYNSCVEEMKSLTEDLGKRKTIVLKDKLADLKETLDDVEMVFFVLPDDPDFIEVNESLARLK